MLDSGDGITYALPTFQGFSYPQATFRMDMAGRDLTHYLMQILTEEREYSFLTSAEREVIKDMKDKLGYVAEDYDKELAMVQTAPEQIEKIYELPDGQVVKLRAERFRCAEAIFQPDLIGIESGGIHEMLYNSIMKCVIDI